MMKEKKKKPQIAIGNFFNQYDISRVCPDTKKMVKNADHEEKTPITYRLSAIGSLYEKFLLNSHLNCNILYFKKNNSFNFVKPNPNDWGICLCSKCLNSELKLEALAKAIQDNCLKWNDTQSYTTTDELIKKINVITYDKTIHFNE